MSDRENTTDYTHPQETNLMSLHRAMEYNPSGQPIVRTTGNSYDWAINLSAGNIDGVGYIEKFGRNDTMSGNMETIWDGSNLYTYLSSASSVYITSSDAADSTSGTGARTIEVQGLDASYNVITEDVTVDDGASTATFIRVFRARTKTTGSGGEAAGVISIRSAASGAGTLLAQIQKVGTGGGSSLGQTFMAVYTVPAGKTAYLTQWTVSAGSNNANTTVVIKCRTFGDGGFNSKDIIISAGQQFAKDYKIPLQFTEKTDIEVRGFTSSAGNPCSSTFNLILIDNV